MRGCSCHGCPTKAKTAAARDQIAPWYCEPCREDECTHEPPPAVERHAFVAHSNLGGMCGWHRPKDWSLCLKPANDPGHEPPLAEPILTPRHEILRFELAGLAPTRAQLHFSPLVSHVGAINDGCQFWIPERTLTGPWVLSFADLERAYMAARAARGKA